MLFRSKAVKGQDSKTLVTAGTIKRPLPCPVEGIEKKNRGCISQREKKNRARGKRKKIRMKTERKGKKTKKERRKLVQRACTNGSVSLSPPSKSHLSPKNASKNFPIGTITI